jgi:ABC-type polysaccharide/polyol phosphate transport system ATPase subunit
MAKPDIDRTTNNPNGSHPAFEGAGNGHAPGSDGAENGHTPGPDGVGNGHAPEEPVNLMASGLLTPALRPTRPAEERIKVIKFSHVSKRFYLHAARPKSFQDMLVGMMGRAKLTRPPAELAPVREFWALRDVNFSIYQGEAVGIIGENGSGKSTTLKLISRILYPNEGTVNVRGKISALLELGTGFHPDLTGRENVFLNGSLLGMSRKAMEGLYAEIVDFAELGQFIEQPIKWYSSGMVMRLGFAVAITVNPDILITDEVLAVGDEAFQRKCLEAIARIRRTGKTIIFVSHALEAVRALCQRVIWLDHGEVIADGKANAVIDQYLDHSNQRHRARLEAEYAESRALPAADQAAATEAGAAPAEAESAAAADGAEPTRPASRWGSGEILITEVQFLDGSGAPAQVFQTGDPLTIRILYHAREPVDQAVFGLALYTSNGVHINGPNTRFSGYDVAVAEGDGYIDYRIAELPLMPGVYDLTVAVTNADSTVMFDHQHNWYHFVVQLNPDLPDRWGLLYVPGTWSRE